ncbi:uncharacterized protein LOC105690928 [Athalia rosae]|uniref:uncharacterized protein LOC105690928 n=1 Tax=Athalia rosae TaxID=37344 RepID=UPI002033CD5E|nr:uncharacterized protein LOC105690928 [Athalia rosae]
MHEYPKMFESVYKARLQTEKYHTVFKASHRLFSLKAKQTINMKFFVAAMLLALVAVALADTKPQEVESVEPSDAQVRDKRGVLLGAAAYTAPVAYSAYTAPVAPVAYSAYSALPYAYSAYPYYASAYSAPYIVG